MDVELVLKRSRSFAKLFRITNGKKFRLRDIDPGDTLGLGSEELQQTKHAPGGAGR